MHAMSRSRGPRIAFLPVVLVLAVAGCVSPGASPAVLTSPSPSAPVATPTATTRLPTPVPTIPAPSGVPGVTDPPASSAALVIRLTSCSDACGPVAGTTIMDDGQIIWQDEEMRTFEARLTKAGLARVRDRIDDVGPLASDGSYFAQLRPGAEPLPRGLTTYRFEVQRATGLVVVASGEPADFSTEPDLWIISPEMAALATLASQLGDPASWLGADALAEPAHLYVPARYLVVVDLVPGIGDEGGVLPDVDDVDWPLGNPIETIGVPVGRGDDGPAPRCRIVDAATAIATASAESAEGVARDLRQWTSSVQYAWQRADGFVQVTMIQLLPHETGPCPDLVLIRP